MNARSVAAALGAMMVFTRPALATCSDKGRDGRESDVDCGGNCPACERGNLCRLASDCASGLCAGGVCTERAHVPGTPVPLGYRLEASDVDGAAITRKIGWVSLGAGYGAAFVAALSLPTQLSWLYVPVLGPWIKVADSSQRRRGFIALDGFFQTVGGALLLGGIVASGQQVVRDDPTLAARVHVTPVVGASGGGLLMYGSF